MGRIIVIIGLLFVASTTVVVVYLTIEKEGMDKPSCDELYTEIRSDIEEANFCDIDADCDVLVLGGQYVEFGCYHFVNKDTDKEVFYERMDKYYSIGCDRIINDCDSSPTPTCLEGKCVYIESETLGWERYTNPNYGFGFRFPPGSAVSEYSDQKTSENSYMAVTQVEFGSCGISFHGIPFGSPDLDIEVTFDQVEVGEKVVERKNTVYPEDVGFSFITLDYPQNPKRPDYPYFFIYHSLSDECREDIDKILSTFYFFHF